MSSVRTQIPTVALMTRVHDIVVEVAVGCVDARVDHRHSHKSPRGPAVPQRLRVQLRQMPLAAGIGIAVGVVVVLARREFRDGEVRGDHSGVLGQVTACLSQCPPVELLVLDEHAATLDAYDLDTVFERSRSR